MWRVGLLPDGDELADGPGVVGVVGRAGRGLRLQLTELRIAFLALVESGTVISSVSPPGIVSRALPRAFALEGAEAAAERELRVAPSSSIGQGDTEGSAVPKSIFTFAGAMRTSGALVSRKRGRLTLIVAIDWSVAPFVVGDLQADLT